MGLCVCVYVYQNVESAFLSIVPLSESYHVIASFILNNIWLVISWCLGIRI